VSAPTSAAIDIGSNSVHLLIARRGDDGLPTTLLDVSHQAGIGREVDATGELGEELRGSLLATLDQYVGLARARGAETIVLLGTEATRRASDAATFLADVRVRTGLDLMVLDRATEGLLTLLGVAGGRVTGSLAVVDIGGGSTEVTVAHPAGPPVVGVLPVGSARLAAAHVRHDPVTDEEVRTLRHAARELVSTLDVPRADRAVVAGGSGTNVSRLLGRERTTPVDRATMEAALGLLRTSPAEALAAGTGLTPHRVRQLAAGLAIGEALLDRLGLDVVEVSDASLREGVLIAAWAAGTGWPRALVDLAGGASRVAGDAPAAGSRDRAS
jgi:exopolyphosphatase/guanosine-5'-triphosphate,3'-diphosphate pyrophosphatase